MGVTPINSNADLYKAINGSISKPAVINFGAESSGPCQSIMPVYEELSQEFPNIAFYYIDMDEAIDTMDICRSISIAPTFWVYKNLQQITKFSGASEVKLRELATSLQ